MSDLEFDRREKICSNISNGKTSRMLLIAIAGCACKGEEKSVRGAAMLRLNMSCMQPWSCPNVTFEFWLSRFPAIWNSGFLERRCEKVMRLSDMVQIKPPCAAIHLASALTYLNSYGRSTVSTKIRRVQSSFYAVRSASIGSLSSDSRALRASQ